MWRGYCPGIRTPNKESYRHRPYTEVGHTKHHVSIAEWQVSNDTGIGFSGPFGGWMFCMHSHLHWDLIPSRARQHSIHMEYIAGP